MNDRTWDDEALSAFLDDEAGAEPRTPADEARLGQLRAAAAAVATPPPAAPPEARETALAAALAELERARPDEVASRRARRRSRSLDWRVLAPVAAAVLALGVAAPLFTDRDGRGQQVAGPMSDNDAALQTEAATTADASGGAAGAGRALSAAVDVGDVTTVDELTARLRPFLPSHKASAFATGEGAATADDGADEARRQTVAAPPVDGAAAPERCAGGDVVFVASARWQGTPAVVLVLPAREGQNEFRLEVRDAESCQLLTTASVEPEDQR
jgi:hypothetical protein